MSVCDIGPLLRAAFDRITLRRPDRDMRASIERLNAASDAAYRKPTMGDILDATIRDRR